jgi:glutathione S-transferase
MITLYHCAAARSFRPLWTLEELGLTYDLKMLPFPPRVFAKEYLGLNPLGTIPLLLDGDTRMTESAAIAQYLVTRYGPTPLAVGVDEPDFGAYLNWLHFGEATLTFPQTLVLRYTELEPEERRNPQVAADYTKWFFGRLRGVEAAVTNSACSVPADLLLPIFPSDMRCCWRRESDSPGSSVRRLRPTGSDCRRAKGFAGLSRPRISPVSSRRSRDVSRVFDSPSQCVFFTRTGARPRMKSEGMLCLKTRSAQLASSSLFSRSLVMM